MKRLKSIFRKHKKIGIAFSGGAARGLAHIGVIKVLQEKSIPVSFVAGASVGSLIGALYASGMSWQAMVEMARDLEWRDLAQITFPKLGFAKQDRLESMLTKILGDKRFEDLQIPMAMTTVDICTGEEYVIKSGPIARAVHASASVPGIFEPTVIDGRYLVDGGLKDNLPVSVLREMGADFVIAVELNRQPPDPVPPKNVLEVLYRSYQIILALGKDAAKECDVLIAPDLSPFNYFDLHQVDGLVKSGEEATRQALERIIRAY
ncbi:MAG: hypothetical protein EHM28_04070 [Spirochaetaceae bacterium]|nr:MAG: hypothetical protein EHM28_04070 [Spirochaetaceae bacterium]